MNKSRVFIRLDRCHADYKRLRPLGLNKHFSLLRATTFVHEKLVYTNVHAKWTHISVVA